MMPLPPPPRRGAPLPPPPWLSTPCQMPPPPWLSTPCQLEARPTAARRPNPRTLAVPRACLRAGIRRRRRREPRPSCRRRQWMTPRRPRRVAPARGAARARRRQRPAARVPITAARVPRRQRRPRAARGRSRRRSRATQLLSRTARTCTRLLGPRRRRPPRPARRPRQLWARYRPRSHRPLRQARRSKGKRNAGDVASCSARPHARSCWRRCARRACIERSRCSRHAPR